MDTSKIDSSLWGRNDYPWDKYFSNNADDSVLNWKPSGAEPDMQSPAVRTKMNAMLGKIAVVIPPELEEKMKNNTELAQKVMERVDSFLLANSTPGENEGFLMTFDENGEINHACVVGELKFTVSSSEFVEARRAREAKHAEYERLAEEAVLKRRLMEQEADKRYYKDSMTNVSKFEVKQDMPGLTIRGHGRLRMTEGPSLTIKILSRRKNYGNFRNWKQLQQCVWEYIHGTEK